jgi:hypothetical protein
MTQEVIPFTETQGGLVIGIFATEKLLGQSVKNRTGVNSELVNDAVEIRIRGILRTPEVIVGRDAQDSPA